MDLVNATGLSARVSLSPDPSVPDAHFGVVSAKATFRVQPGGRCDLDSETALPLWDENVPGPLGILPNDLPQIGYTEDTRCELFLLGAAYAGGRPHITATIRIAEWFASIDVWGPQHELDGAASAPEPFERMPLTWENTFGGTGVVWIDAASPMDVGHAGNPCGSGYDIEAAAKALESALGCPEGFPRWARGPRRLPSVVELAANPLDTERPVSWSPPPPEVTCTVERHLARWRAAHPEDDDADMEWLTAFRADPSMVFSVPPLGHEVVLENCHPAGTSRFRLPPIRVHADYVADGRTGSLELEARRIVLLPEEDRFYITFHSFVRLRDRVEGGERSFRLRVE